MTPRAQDVTAAVALVQAIAAAIRDLGEVPAGHLYAGVMSQMSLATFERIIGILVAAGLVRREASHLLVWVGERASL